MAILHEHIEGKYEILGKLREGGMGAVYKVRHRLLDEVLVVKVLNPRLDVTPELNDRFLREARFAIQLRHPNIAQLHDFSIAEDGSAFIVMEFIDGATLEDIVKRTGPPPLGLGLEMARQSLKALGFLHRRGLIHRDISPDNLMLTRDAEGEPLVKLIDLGIAKVLKGGAGGLTSTGMFLGKPRYASPEQFSANGLAGVDARADLYSFGVVLYELLTGVCPIQGRDPGSLMAGHLFRPPVDFAESDREGRLPADLRAILLRVLAKAPDERFASAEELSRALGEVQDRYPVRPGELEAVLRAAALPAPAAPAPGTTQGKLDQQFVQTPIPAGPAGTQPAGKALDTTLVLTPFERPARLPETLAIPREPIPVAAPPPLPVPPVPLMPPPVVPAVAAIPPRVEAPRPIRPPARPPEKRRSLLSLDVILALLLLAGVGVGIWLWARRSAPAPATPAETMAQTSVSVEPPAPAVPAVAVSPPPQSAPVESAQPRTAPEPTPSAPFSPPPPPPAPVKELAVKKPLKKAETREAAAAPAQHHEPPPPEAPKPEPKPAASASPRQAPSAVSDDAGVDVPPRFVSVPPPVIPAAARGTGSYARIRVAVRVDALGAVIDTKVKNAYMEEGASPTATGANPPTGLLAAFREAARDAARNAKFQPAQKNGQPVIAWGELTFEFGKKPGT